MTKEQNLKAMHTLQYYNGEKQMLKCVEELTELTEAIMKHVNKGDNRAAIFEEIVDVEIMIAQMKVILPYGEDAYDVEIDRKLDRQLERIRSGKYEGRK